MRLCFKQKENSGIGKSVTYLATLISFIYNKYNNKLNKLNIINGFRNNLGCKSA